MCPWAIQLRRSASPEFPGVCCVFRYLALRLSPAQALQEVAGGVRWWVYPDFSKTKKSVPFLNFNHRKERAIRLQYCIALINPHKLPAPAASASHIQLPKKIRVGVNNRARESRSTLRCRMDLRAYAVGNQLHAMQWLVKARILTGAQR